MDRTVRNLQNLKGAKIGVLEHIPTKENLREGDVQIAAPSGRSPLFALKHKNSLWFQEFQTLEDVGYYTDERVDDRVNDLLVAGTNVQLTYDDAANALTINAVNDTFEENTQDVVGGMVTGNTETLIDVTYDDTDGTLDFVVQEANIDHDNLTNFLAVEHRAWENSITQNIHANNITEASVTQHEAAISHDNLSGYVADEHIDWTPTGATTDDLETTGNVDAGSFFITGTKVIDASRNFSGVNATLSGYLDLTEITIPTNPSATAGRLYATDASGKTEIRVLDSDGESHVLMQDNYEIVRNVSGVAMSKGDAVYLSGETGVVSEVSLAKANSTTTMPAVGILAEDIADNGYGRMMLIGVIESFDTSAYTAGDDLYVSATTAGALTATKPSVPTNIAQRVGHVHVSGVGNGKIQVYIHDQQGVEQGTRHDFTVTGALAANTLRPDSGKFLSPVSYQFRNAGDTGFRNVQMAALTATNATLSGTLSVDGTGDSYIMGNVGIGTASPISPLNVKGASDGTADSGDVSMRLGGSNTEGRMFFDVDVVNDDSYIDMYSNGTYKYLRIEANPLVLNKNGGNVGIGTTAPEYELQIEKNVSGGAGPEILLNNVGNGSTYTGRTGAVHFYNWSGNTDSDTNRAGSIIFETMTESAATDLAFRLFSGGSGSQSEIMRLKSNGNVGIGTTAPDNNLHIFEGDSGGSSQSNAHLTIEDSDYSYIQTLAGTTGWGGLLFGDSGSSVAGAIYYSHGGDYMRFDSAGTANAMIIKGGNVGIGTTSPRKLTDFLSTTQAQLRLSYTDNSVYADFQVGSGGNLTVAPTGDYIFDPAGNDVYPNTNYDLDLGLINKKWLTLHAAELWVETLVAQDTMATIGGRILVGPTTELTADVAAVDTTIEVKHNEMASGDIVYLESNGKVEFLSIDSAPSGTGPYTYTVTRNLDASGANDWYAGDAVFNTGASGDGFIDMYSLSGVDSAGAGPTIVGNVRNSATYNDWTEHWAIGNLNGLYGYGVDTYGVGLGKYSSANYLTIDATDGIRFYDSSDAVQAQLSGTTWTLGATTAEHVNITSTAVQLKDGSTVYTDLAGGTLTLGDSTAGEYVVIDGTAGIELYGGGTQRVQISNDGSGWFVSASDISWTTGGVLDVNRITASDGTIANWTIATNILSSGSTSLNSSTEQLKFDGGTVAFGSGTGVLIGLDSTAYKMYAGNGTEYFLWDGANISWAGGNSSMDPSGNITTENITATGGSIAGFTIQTNSLYKTVGDPASKLLRWNAGNASHPIGFQYYNIGEPTGEITYVELGQLHNQDTDTIGTDYGFEILKKTGTSTFEHIFRVTDNQALFSGTVTAGDTSGQYITLDGSAGTLTFNDGTNDVMFLKNSVDASGNAGIDMQNSGRIRWYGGPDNYTTISNAYFEFDRDSEDIILMGDATNVNAINSSSLLELFSSTASAYTYALDVSAGDAHIAGDIYIENELLFGSLNLYGVTIDAALKTDDNFIVGGGRLTIGADTNLYRSAADTLKTDDDFVVGGNLTVSNIDTSLTINGTSAPATSLDIGATSGTATYNSSAFTVDKIAQLYNVWIEDYNDGVYLRAGTNDTGHLVFATRTGNDNFKRAEIDNAGKAWFYGDVDIAGNLTKGTGSFKIPHPLQPETHDLYHSFVESPTAGDNIYRYTVTVSEGKAVIDMPDYFKPLNKDIHVHVTPVDHYGRGFGAYDRQHNAVTIDADTDGEYRILIIGTRQDIHAERAWQGVERART